MRGSVPNCLCRKGCPRNLRPVCGSDNVTYDNKCLLELKACETLTMITVISESACSRKNELFLIFFTFSYFVFPVSPNTQSPVSVVALTQHTGSCYISHASSKLKKLQIDFLFCCSFASVFFPGSIDRQATRSSFLGLSTKAVRAF